MKLSVLALVFSNSKICMINLYNVETSLSSNSIYIADFIMYTIYLIKLYSVAVSLCGMNITI